MATICILYRLFLYGLVLWKVLDGILYKLAKNISATNTPNIIIETVEYV